MSDTETTQQQTEQPKISAESIALELIRVRREHVAAERRAEGIRREAGEREVAALQHLEAIRADNKRRATEATDAAWAIHCRGRELERALEAAITEGR